MILFFRKYLVKILLIVSIITVIAGILFYTMEFMNPHILSKDFSSGQSWWLAYYSAENFNPLETWLFLMVSDLYSLIFGFFVYRQIKKNPSPQLSFLYLFIFTFSLQIIRLGYLLPQSSAFHIDKELITRIIYFSRLFALTAFFSTSLFSTGLQIQKFNMVLLITVLLSFSMSIIIPLNTIELTTSLLFRIAAEKSLALFCIALEILTAMNFFYAAIKQARVEFYRLFLFSIMILNGYELMFFLYIPFLLPGSILLLAGTILYIRTSQKMFLWA
ncbi:MAG: hypothetical protein B6241_08420 [Spirochaetaceae bacterium 4572_59]|nr:MAG: hypothetical protein B6241_08420 [Spirochaetaceae bacterium 4572_59]